MAQQSVADIERLSGIQLPADSRFLYQGDSGRQGEAFRQYVLQSNSDFQIHKDSVTMIPYESVAATVATVVPIEKTGKVNPSEARVADWVNDHGEWRASILSTDHGWILQLENLNAK